MRKLISISILIGAQLTQGCSTEPDLRESYNVEYFCFDGFRGIGVVSVPNTSGSYSVNIYAEANESAPQVASLVAEISSNEKRFSLTNVSVVDDGLFEFANEQLGLPVESIEGNWIKVRLGKDAAGNLLSGWVENIAPVVLQKWETYLRDRATFLAICDAPVLYKSPNGEAFFPKVKYRYDDVTETKRPDYRIESVEVSGDWIKVQLVTPSNLCEGMSQGAIVVEGWVPLLLDDESPAVWFHTRGC